VPANAGSETKWPFGFLDVIANYADRQVELANTIFGFSSSLLFWIGDKLKLFGDTMSIARHGGLLFTFQLFVHFGNQLASYIRVLNMRVAIDKALPLFPELHWRHFDAARTLHQRLKLFSHWTNASRFTLPTRVERYRARNVLSNGKRTFVR
jgi:hypothetical protein